MTPMTVSRILTESQVYDAQENRELPPHPEGASGIPLVFGDDPAEINLVTLTLLQFGQCIF